MAANFQWRRFLTPLRHQTWSVANDGMGDTAEDRQRHADIATVPELLPEGHLHFIHGSSRRVIATG